MCIHSCILSSLIPVMGLVGLVSLSGKRRQGIPKKILYLSKQVSFSITEVVFPPPATDIIPLAIASACCYI